MKLDIIFHYEVDSQTGEIKYIGKEEITLDTVKSTKSSKSTKIDDNPVPIVTLESNKLVLTSGAVKLLNAEEGCRININYKKEGKYTKPVIGTSDSFGTKGGNILTKTNTVSYRGSANERLATYGDTFKLEPTDKNGIFYLVGDKDEVTIPDETINIIDELDIESLEDIELSLDDEINTFNFTL